MAIRSFLSAIVLIYPGFVYSQVTNQRAPSPVKKEALILKVSEITSPKTKPMTLLNFRFDCASTRYTAWIVSRRGVRAGDVEIQLDSTVQWKQLAEKRGERVLALEDATGDSEKNLIDRLGGVSMISVIFKDKEGNSAPSKFIISGIHQKLKAAETECSKD